MAIQNVTVTAPIGPGGTVTSLVLNNCRSVKFDAKREVVEVEDEGGKMHEFEYETIATVTYTISGETATVAIST
jgi:hypothetical protein